MNELDGWSQWALALRTQVEGAEVQVVFLAATLFEMTASPLLAGFFFFPFFWTMLCGTWDLCSSSRDGTQAHYSGSMES